MKKLLVISGRGFPPENETGIFRVLKFVKYLSRLGWQSVVLAPKINVETKKDDALVKDIPEGTKVVRTTNLTLMFQHHSMQKLAKSLLMFDGDIGWYPTAYRKGRDIIKDEGVDAIFSTSPPPDAVRGLLEPELCAQEARGGHRADGHQQCRQAPVRQST
jgi:hypothetical protein